ncbi:hypothetical protein [Sulfurimonas sp.]|uniref:hypothetical protein n=1 Tax=Sulfurimonas sp. TaxID=2022749 RepID=UPI002B488D8A|nr:hypothetical protein [Sulfurimonas sp.]
MLDNAIDDIDFSKLMQKHIQELVIHFFQKEQNFGILCNIEDIYFEPKLPQDIANEFRPLTLFFLAGYTFESAHIQDSHLVFEAGFGTDNFGSVVSVPLLSVLQIIVDETPLLINLATHKLQTEPKADSSPKGVENSMTSFLSNPENSKFIKE